MLAGIIRSSQSLIQKNTKKSRRTLMFFSNKTKSKDLILWHRVYKFSLGQKLFLFRLQTNDFVS